MSDWRAVLKDDNTKQGKLTDFMSFSATVSPLNAEDWFKKPVKRKKRPKQATDTVQTRLDGTIEEE